MSSVESTSKVRIVPSGQIYRQLFDAQLQLSKSLAYYENGSQSLKSLDLSLDNGLRNFSVIHLEKEPTQHGLLTSRQKSWVKGYPNDPYTENPVLYKQYSEYMQQKIQATEALKSEQDVRGLPDIIVPQKTGSNIIERIAESRKKRHEAAVEEMYQELYLLNSEMEPLLEFESSQLLKKLKEDDSEIETILLTLQDEMSLSRLETAWDDILSHSEKRRNWIIEMDKKLKSIETERMNKIKIVFNQFGEKFNTIAHLASSDLQRFLDKETQMINQTMLSNQRSYADLYVRLLSADIEREKAQRILWQRRVEDWKTDHIKTAIKNFDNFMLTDSVRQPESIVQVMTEFKSHQEKLKSQCMALIETMGDMKPPASTKSSVYKWRNDMNKIILEIDSVSQMYLSKLYEEYEKVCQLCLDKINIDMTNLIDSGICSSHRARQLMDEFMLPLVGQQQRAFELDLENLEKPIEVHKGKLEEEVNAVFKFSQGTAHLWDVHEIGLAKQERALQEKLEESRHTHDQSNQEKEAHLDLVMDRMRQDANDVALKDSLIKANLMLEKIRESYFEFHQQQTELVQSYPNMINAELIAYEKGICTFFSVAKAKDRLNEVKEEQPEQEIEEQSEEKEAEEVDFEEELSELSNESLNQVEINMADVVKQMLQTSRGTEFYLLPDNNLRLAQDLDTEGNEDEDSSTIHEVIKNFDLSKSFIDQTKLRIRQNFLEHLDEWFDEATDRSKSIVLAKCQEINSELDLRLHLHQPRHHRAEFDIHNVRAAELVMHSERVVRHCAGMDKRMGELTASFKAMNQEHNKLASKFHADIQALEVIFVNATKSSRLVNLQNQLVVEKEKFMTTIRTSLRQFRQHLDETLQMLRESNARFIKAFKLFSDGGNFCPEEIEDYRKKLEKMSQLIDSTEGSIMSELEGMESKRLDSATKICLEFEERFKSHMNDLVFMERVSRWLTNTQVKIKSEVANSNTQAQNLDSMLNILEQRISACKKRNMDKEQITSNQLNDSLEEIFAAFIKRGDYLQKERTETVPPGKVGFINEAAGKTSKPMEDPTFATIKSILKSQRNKLRFGAEAALDGEEFKRAKSAISQTSSKGSEQSITKINQKSGVDGKKPGTAALRNSRLIKMDKKPATNEERKNSSSMEQFIVKIQNILKEALDGLLSTAEVFYAQKGTSLVTRPQALQETFEQFSEVISQKVASYDSQADDYHNQCLQEFRLQLVKLEELCAQVPGLVIQDFVQDKIIQSNKGQEELVSEFQSILDQLAGKKEAHKKELRPALGHPNLADDLALLCAMENERHMDFIEQVTKLTTKQQECALKNSKQFLEEFIQLNTQLLSQFDNMLLTDEVNKGRVEPKLLPTSELIRRKIAGKSLEEEESISQSSCSISSWLGVPINQFCLDGLPSKLELSPTITTSKTTSVHFAIIKSRDSAYQAYRKTFDKILEEIETNKNNLLVAESWWEQSWTNSVNKVKSLY